MAATSRREKRRLKRHVLESRVVVLRVRRGLRPRTGTDEVFVVIPKMGSGIIKEFELSI